MYDYLVVGAGLFGASFAQQARSCGKKVLVIDKRDHIGGNAFTENVEGVTVHRYGAHIFHTNEKRVFDYLSGFTVFNRFTNSPVAFFDGKVYSLPFNMYTFNSLWGVTTPEEAKEIIRIQRQEIAGEPRNLEEQAISLVGRDVYERLIKGYTEKQWGRSCKELPAFIIRRIPVRFTYDNNYFNAMYQGIPTDGYTKMVERMLSGIEVRLGEPYEKGKYDAAKTVYTGSVDEYFDFCYGPLSYRSIRFENEILDGNYQGNAVVNYTDAAVPWTRIIEHKWFTFGKDENGKELDKTVISREYSCEWTPGIEPYYPVNDELNNALYARYQKLAEKERNVLFGGRLGSYKYYDMDQVVLAALELADSELKNG